MNNGVWIGNLVDDVKLDAIPNSDNFVASGTIAINDYKSSKENEVDYIRFKIYGKDRASLIAEKTTRGCKISIMGRLKIDKYEKDGIKKEFSYIRVSEYEILSWKKEDSSIFDEAEVVNLG